MILIVGEKVWDITAVRHELLGVVIGSFLGNDQKIMTRVRKETGEIVEVPSVNLNSFHPGSYENYKKEGEEAFIIGKRRMDNPYKFPSPEWEGWDQGYINPTYRDGLECSTVELERASPL